MLIQKIYPSSKVDPDIISAFGWEFVEDIPTTTNEVGRLAPAPKRSDIHKALRAALEVNGVAVYEASSGRSVELTDFAIAESPTTEQTLGFFALK